MKMLTVDEAVAGLSRWVDLALAGELIQIRKGDAVVELRAAAASAPSPKPKEQLSPREALRAIQAESRLTTAQAEDYLREVHQERLAAEDRLPG
jgi:antitoxin (DNA-binding transcriptional repressor) of toxin-antitoxin stability system